MANLVGGGVVARVYNSTLTIVLLPFRFSCPLHFRVNNVRKTVNFISLKQSRNPRQFSLIPSSLPTCEQKALQSLRAYHVLDSKLTAY